MSEPRETDGAREVEPRVDAILLAAGSSRRFGAANKLLAEVGGVPLVRRTALTLAAVFRDRLIIVLGHEAAAIRDALAGLDCRLVENPRHAEGIATSVAIGIAAVHADADAVLIAQADMPGLGTDLLARLLARVRETNACAIVHPVAPDGRQATPVVWPRDLFSELAALDGDQGAKPLITRHAGRVATVDAPAEEVIDVDTPEALEAWRRTNPGRR